MKEAPGTSLPGYVSTLWEQEHRMEQKLGAGAEEGQREAEKRRWREISTSGSLPAWLAVTSNAAQHQNPRVPFAALNGCGTSKAFVMLRSDLCHIRGHLVEETRRAGFVQTLLCAGVGIAG